MNNYSALALPPETRLAVIELPCGQLLSFSSRHPIKLVCRSGRAWLSESGRDVILQAGQHFEIRARERIVVEAMQGAARLAFLPGGAAFERNAADIFFEIGLPTQSRAG